MEPVTTTLKRDGLVALFCVCPPDAKIAGALAGMGFRRDGDDFVRSFVDSDAVPRIFERFRGHIDEMVRYKLGVADAPWDAALELVAERLSGADDWWLTGSAALAVRGIAVHPRDVDLVAQDARLVGRLLDDLLVEPVTRSENWVAGWFGRAFHGALIEWIAEVEPDVEERGPHEQGPTAASRREQVVWRGHEILCTPLDISLAVCEARGLDERVRAIRMSTP
jgi:hypothetical protein